MRAADLHQLAITCGFHANSIVAAVVRTEANGGPFAIGVVGGHLVRQAAKAAEATATDRALKVSGWHYSLGAAQICCYTLARFGLDEVSAFEPCPNIGGLAFDVTSGWAE